MTRIVDSMKTRIEKLKAKILPLQNELDSLEQAVSIMEKQEPVSPSNSEVDKEPSPHFLGKGHDKKSASES